MSFDKKKYFFFTVYMDIKEEQCWRLMLFLCIASHLLLSQFILLCLSYLHSFEKNSFLHWLKNWNLWVDIFKISHWNIKCYKKKVCIQKIIKDGNVIVCVMIKIWKRRNCKIYWTIEENQDSNYLCYSSKILCRVH